MIAEMRDESKYKKMTTLKGEFAVTAEFRAEQLVMFGLGGTQDIEPEIEDRIQMQYLIHRLKLQENVHREEIKET